MKPIVTIDIPEPQPTKVTIVVSGNMASLLLEILGKMPIYGVVKDSKLEEELVGETSLLYTALRNSFEEKSAKPWPEIHIFAQKLRNRNVERGF